MSESLHKIDTDCRASHERARARRIAAERMASRLTIGDLLLALGVAVLAVLTWAVMVFTGYMVGLAVGL